MYKRLLSGIMIVAMTLELCAGTSLAAEKSETRVQNTQEQICAYDDSLSETESEESSEITETSETKPEESSEITETSETKPEESSEITETSETESETESEIFSDEDAVVDEVEEGSPDFLYQAGGFKVMDLKQNTVSLQSVGEFRLQSEEKENTSELADLLYEALKNKEEKIDISAFEFQSTDTDDRQILLMTYYAVINDHPELYYVRTKYSISYGATSKIIFSIKPSYHTDIDSDAFDAAVEKAKAVVNDDMDDLQKVIAIHEYLVLNCEYDKERLDSGAENVPAESYSAYGVLVNRIGVCQGYALAFKYLMNEFGIECYIVTSDEKNHAWNMVYLNGEYYHLDATWDDPTWDKYGLVRHDYLLVSDQQLAKDSGHSPWYVTKGSGIVERTSTDTTYDDYFWRGVLSPLTYDKERSRYYYVSDESQNLVGRDYDSVSDIFKQEEILKESIGTKYSGLALDGNRLYYNTLKNIVSVALDRNNEETVRFTLDDGNNIYGFTKSGSTINYVKRTSYYLSGKSMIYSLEDAYIISYELYGGVNSKLNPTLYAEDSDTIVLKNPTHQDTHYIFEGWYTDAAFTNKISAIEKGSIGDIELYAKWVKYYHVTFLDGFGNVLSEKDIAQGGDAQTPELTVPEGYEMKGWNGACTDVQGDLVISAIYEPVEYTITYVLNQGVNSDINPASYTIETETFSLAEPTFSSENIRFGGWYLDEQCTNQVTAIEKGTTGDLELYAKWVKYYHVTFLDGFGNMLSEESVAEGEDAQPPKLTVPEGYEMKGWDGACTDVHADLVIRAVYEPMEYTITYVLNHGTNSDTNPDSYTVETETFILAEPTHSDENIRFKGWYLDREWKNQITAIEKGTTGNLTVYAKWEGIWIDGVTDATYTGKAITFDNIKVYDGTKELRCGVDYTISYRNNINAAKAADNQAPAVIIKGKGNYEGNYTRTFTILPVDLGMAQEVRVEKVVVAYKKGKVQRPTPAVIWNSQKLTANKDFTVAYSQNPIDVGEYDVVISGKGNFTGTVKTTLTITATNEKVPMSSVKIAKKLPDYSYSTEPIRIDESMITLKIGNTQLIAGEDYEFTEYEYQGAGTHYVTIRAKGEKYIGELLTSFNIKGSAASKLKVSSVIYTGETVKPVITDTYGNQLTEGIDYVIHALTGTESVGTAKINFSGINAYYGTATKTFRVKAHSIASDDITVEFEQKGSTQPYEKGGAKPKVIVYYDGRRLQEGTDYKLSYKNNKKAGNIASVTISGKKNFNSKRELSFVVGKGELSNASVKVADKVVSKKAGGYVSNPVITDSNGKKLSAGTDYERSIVYKMGDRILDKKTDIAQEGDVITAEITGKGNYAGTKVTATYRILAANKDLSKASVKVNTKLYYNGYPVTLSKNQLTVKIGKEILSQDDYEIVADSYGNNQKKGTAKVTIQGKGAYGGTKTISFKIYAKKIGKG